MKTFWKGRGVFRSYLKTIFRNISGSKIYFFINVAGLCIGFTIFTLIVLYVLNELNYDTFNKKADRIYRVVELQKSPGGQVQRVAITMPALGPALQSEFPEIASTVRLIPWPTVLCHSGDRRFYENKLTFADSTIFDIFTFHFIEGNEAKALNDPYSVVIDQTTAARYFGKQNPIGKFITVDADFGQNAFQVTGVVQDFPRNSHLTFNMIASLNTLQNKNSPFIGWADNDVVTYILLNRANRFESVQRKLPEFMATNLPTDLWKGLEIYMQPLKDIHLYSGEILYQVNHNMGNIDTVRLFSLIAFFVIFLACINFVNLTTARSTIRAREVGIRKLLGSYHSHLIYQFIGESIVISFVALLLSLPLVEAFLPTFNSMMRGRIIVSYDNQLPFLLGLCAVALVVGLVAGIYPAFYLSSFRSADLLKGRFGSSKRGILLRKILTTLQFAIAIGLVTATIIVIMQMNFIYDKPLGFNKRGLMYIPLRDTKSRSKIPVLREKLLEDPNILAVSAGELTGSGTTQGKISVPGPGGGSLRIVRESFVDYGYVQTMGMKIVEGRSFSRDRLSDSSSVVVNETMANSFSWKDPIGKKIETANGPTFMIIGVIKDFNYFSLREKVDPLVMWLHPNRCQYLLIRLASRGRSSSIRYVKTTWNALLPSHPFEYSFLSNYLDKQYGSERESEHLLIMFSLVAVLVACLGLFGLTMHTTEQRIKEIGIRKVLGASIADIVLMLSRETIWLVLTACMAAWPVAYYFMARWLNGFAYRIDLTPLTFIFSGVLVFTIAMLTLSFQAINAGLSNPAKALRYE
jgi:putative ABC transport system permease protein